mmetsp:Transcript_22849/g.61952  ORF Transcript_22849/g.61952 Transcript_22849/m.61952 type:complete len:236 (+) Transcript_22849:678-1385(+)
MFASALSTRRRASRRLPSMTKMVGQAVLHHPLRLLRRRSLQVCKHSRMRRSRTLGSSRRRKTHRRLQVAAVAADFHLHDQRRLSAPLLSGEWALATPDACSERIAGSACCDSSSMTPVTNVPWRRSLVPAPVKSHIVPSFTLPPIWRLRGGGGCAYCTVRVVRVVLSLYRISLEGIERRLRLRGTGDQQLVHVREGQGAAAPCMPLPCACLCPVRGALLAGVIEPAAEDDRPLHG